MKIAFIGQKGIPAQSGGVDRHVESLALFLARQGEDIIVYNRSDYLPEKISAWKGITLVYKPYIDNKNFAAISHVFLSTLDAMKRRVDVIHYHGIGPCLLAWLPRLFAPKIKIVATLHSFDYGNDKWSGFAKAMLRLGESLMCRYAHQVIVLTPLMHDYLWQRHNCESTIIPNGAYVEASVKTDVLAAYGLEKDKYIISVSRLIRLKGIQYLIEAWKSLPNEQNGQLKIAIVGEGEYQAELEKLVGDDPRFIFTGNQSGEALAQLYSNAALFVQSSEMEGLSISLLEALAYGRPCLASDISANHEAAGDCALYFASRNAAALKDRLAYAVAHPEEMALLGQKGAERAADKFNWESISRETKAVYQKQKK